MAQKKSKAVWKIKEIAQQRGIENAYQFHTLTGISHTRSAKIWEGTLKLSIEDIETISDSLECEPQELIGRETKNSIKRKKQAK